MNVNRVVLAVFMVCGLSTSSEGLEVQVFWRGNSLAALAGGNAAEGEVPAGSYLSPPPNAPQVAIDLGATYTSGSGVFNIPQNGYMVFAFDVVTAFDLTNFTINTTAVSQSVSFELRQDDPTSGALLANPSGLSSGYNNFSFASPAAFPVGQGQAIFLVNTSPQNLIFTVATDSTPVFVVPEPSAAALGLLASLVVAGLGCRKSSKI